MPFQAIRTLKQLNADCKLVYPPASDMLQQGIYVDDVLSGGHSVTEAKLKLSQLKNALSSPAFALKKITSNHKSLLEHVAREDLLDEDYLSLDYSSTNKTLGIRWDATPGSFYYIVKPIISAATTTKGKAYKSLPNCLTHSDGLVLSSSYRNF